MSNEKNIEISAVVKFRQFFHETGGIIMSVRIPNIIVSVHIIMHVV